MNLQEVRINKTQFSRKWQEDILKDRNEMNSLLQTCGDMELNKFSKRRKTLWSGSLHLRSLNELAMEKEEAQNDLLQLQ